VSRFCTFAIAFIVVVPACAAREDSASSTSPAERETIPSQKVLKVGQIIRDCPDCPEMVTIPQVGHTSDSPGKVMYASRFEITWRQYLIAVRKGFCPVPTDGNGEQYSVDDRKINDDYPLTTIGYNTFLCYTNWISNISGRNYRIPSAQEWEHLARSGTQTEYYWGNKLGTNNAAVIDYFDAKIIGAKIGDPPGWFRNDRRNDVKFKEVYPVGLFPPNQWGLYDVIGNAAEFTTEKPPPSVQCLQTHKFQVCDMRYVRGNDRGRLPNSVDPNPPITESYTTARFEAPAWGGVTHAGFRLVRD
jgi:formylglycine-generating enzyme required for sulfatase activity